jgi:hypothetical protein
MADGEMPSLAKRFSRDPMARNYLRGGSDHLIVRQFIAEFHFWIT